MNSNTLKLKVNLYTQVYYQLISKPNNELKHLSVYITIINIILMFLKIEHFKRTNINLLTKSTSKPIKKKKSLN